jgi:hypothetical protein
MSSEKVKSRRIIFHSASKKRFSPKTTIQGETKLKTDFFISPGIAENSQRFREKKT